MRLIWIILLIIMTPMEMMGQKYDVLWGEVKAAQNNDLPKTEIEALDKIIVKSTDEKEYGHLVKAQLLKVSAVTAITPDSLKPEVDRLVKWEESVRKSNPVLAAVLQSVLGTVYMGNRSLDENYQQISQDYFKKSLSNPKLLANTQAGTFVPALEMGKDSRFFNNDLLHVLGMQAQDYTTLHDYYEAVGNREAACLVSSWILEDMPEVAADQKAATSPRLHAADSLIQRYGDLEVAGELALLRYGFMEDAKDVDAAQLVAYIDEAMGKWGKWPALSELQNARSHLMQPIFSVDAGSSVILPNQERKVVLKQIRNIPSFTMKLSRVDIEADKEYYLSSENDLRKVRKAIVKGTEMEVTHTYPGRQPYEVFEDSMVIPPLTPGVYFVEFISGDKSMDVAYDLMFVSDVFLLSQSLPENKTRFAVVSATTGQPLPKANIRITNREKQDETLVCDNKGEVIYTLKETNGYYIRPDYFVYTDKDRFCPRQNIWGSSFHYSSPRESVKETSIFTDRGIYRPGQEVHVAILRFECVKGLETKALEGQELKVVLKDANYKEVASKNVVTDEYGKAAVDFKLPENGLTGTYTITTTNGRTSFRVEEYKRPTFQVEIEEVEESYKDGDTITVKGHAETYAGVPVQGAKVKYTVKREICRWWWFDDEDSDSELAEDSTVTDEKGDFFMRVPMLLPDTYGALGDWKRARFYDINIAAEVTDQAFETHEARLSLPLSNKATAFDVVVSEKMRKEDMKDVVFRLRNAAGNAVDGEVTYQIDGGNQLSAKANESVKLPLLNSGEHVIEAVCMGDTVKEKFIVFSFDDKKPCIETHSWFYASAGRFPADGTPVTIQVGSSDPDTYVFYSVFSEDRVLEQGTFKLDNANKTRQWTYKEEYGSGIFVTYAWVREGIAYVHTHTISRPLPDKNIRLAWETFRDKLTPGQEETWTLKATLPDGSPADAQIIATLYDLSLEQIESHYWYFNDRIVVNTPYTSWNKFSFGYVSMHESGSVRNVPVPTLDFTEFDSSLFSFSGSRYWNYGRLRRSMSVDMLKAAPNMMMAEAKVEVTALKAMKEEVDESVQYELSADLQSDGVGVKEDKDEEAATEPGKTESVQVRENLDETAFFMPTVATDAEGHFVLKFRLPESITTWRFMGLATDKEINHGRITAQAVAKKDVMVLPNVPRFVRLGDKAQVTTRIFNTTERPISGKVTMELLDPENEAVVYTQTRDFAFEANQTTSATFEYEPEGEARLLVCRIIAQGDGFSDGEQHYLPVLPCKELITRTMPFTQNGQQTTTISLDKLFPKGVEGSKLTVEYTNNPAWLMIQALPTMAPGDSENAITQAMSYYANALGQYIMNLSPAIKKTVMQWREETDSENTMVSNLAKNEELKDLMLNETPWVGQADNEESQKRSLVKFFDEETINIRIKKALEKLNDLQLPDGSWAWWKGMEGSPYMTTAVSEMFIRLNAMVGKRADNQKMLNKAFEFMDKKLQEEEEYLRKMEAKGSKVRPSEMAVNILYNYALDGREASNKMKSTINYFVDLLEGKTGDLTIFGKARCAVVLAHFGKEKKAQLFMKSLSEYSVATEDMGRYYDTRKAYYSWCSYNIPTEVAAIEAYKKLEPDNLKVLDEMRIWLLQQKRAQMWNTPINSVDAVYAFLAGNMQSLDNGVETRLAIDGETLPTSQATAGVGYVKTAVDAKGKSTFTAKKNSTGTAWGALYAQFTQKAEEVTDTKAGLSVTREIRSEKGDLKVGDKVVVRITIKAERNLDFVEVIDRRAACMEPVQQLSGYRMGCYIAPKDNTTTYYFNHMGKGTHVVETEYYIDRMGTYETGTCKAQCAYAPEFSATTKAMKVVVNK